MKKIYIILKQAYYVFPHKIYFFLFFRKVYKPSYKLAKYLKFKGVFNVKVNNKTFKLYSNNTALESLIFWRGIYSFEPFSIKIWAHLSCESNVIFDIGANTGVYSLVSATLNPEATIYSFEPIKRIYEVLNKNVSINKFQQINTFPYAVSSFTGESDFYDMDDFDNQIASFIKSHLEKHEHAKNIKKIKVSVINIDDFIKTKQINKIDLIKVDVEGVEDKVFEGMQNTLKYHRPIIICEISDQNTAAKTTKLFTGLEYLFFDIDETGKLIENKKIIKSNLNYLLIPKEKKHKIDHFI